ncbi:MAG TPA: glycosyltransferase family 9 protein [Thermoanaerobaculia bacterium]|jgi:lipopolysaccharide heptosyltransferase I
MNDSEVQRSSFIVHRSLLVLRLSALGDVIHTIPAVAALRETYDVSWVVERPYAELVEIVAQVHAIPVRIKKWARAPLVHRREIAEARRALRGFDAAIDFQGLMKSGMLGLGARQRIGFTREAIREKPALLFTNEKRRVDTSKHIIEQNLELARVAPGEGNWRSFPRPVDAHGDIVLLPGAGKANKLWPAERFRRVAQHFGDRVLVAWGPHERELAAAIGARAAPPTDLRQLAFLLQRARVVVGGDTGPLHLAAALGTKVVGLYGPTDPRRNGPYGQLNRCINVFPSAKSMDAISVEEVVKLIERVLAE